MSPWTVVLAFCQYHNAAYSIIIIVIQHAGSALQESRRVWKHQAENLPYIDIDEQVNEAVRHYTSARTLRRSQFSALVPGTLSPRNPCPRRRALHTARPRRILRTGNAGLWKMYLAAVAAMSANNTSYNVHQVGSTQHPAPSIKHTRSKGNGDVPLHEHNRILSLPGGFASQSPSSLCQ